MSTETMSIRILSNGERMPVLMDHQGVPLFYPTLFVTSQLRNAGAAVNTIRNKLEDIRVLLRWEFLQQRSLLREMQDSKWLTLPDVAALRDFAMLDMRVAKQDKRRQKEEGGRSVHGTGNACLPRAIVGVQQHYNRLTTIAEYLEFAGRVATQHRGSSAVRDEISRMVKSIRAHRPRGVTLRTDSRTIRDHCALKETIERFMQVGSENHQANPFARSDVRLRNALIFGVLRCTGMRRGELLSLRIDQLDLGHNPLIWVRRNQDDRHDTRRNQPVAKTMERPLSIATEVAEMLQRYIMEVRASIAPARKHPYLLVVHKKGKSYGQPLSISSLTNKIFGRMAAVDPAFSAIHPHVFRHNFNYELSVAIDRHNSEESCGAKVSEARELDIRAFLNGHRSRASGQVYNQRRVRELGDAAMRRIHEELLIKKERSDDAC